MRLLAIENFIVFLFSRFLIFKYSKIKSPINPRLFWGPVPTLNNYYWSDSMAQEGFKSNTIMSNYFSKINSKENFDFYFDEILNSIKMPKIIKRKFSNWLIFNYCLKNYDIFHIPYSGGILSKTKFWKLESKILISCNKKIVMIPYGADAFIYSRIKSSSQQHSLLINYPAGIKNEQIISEKIMHFQINANFCIGGGQIDGFSRWDSLALNVIGIDINKWKKKNIYSSYNGSNKEVVVVHSPNHRGVKGTEFLIKAIDD